MVERIEIIITDELKRAYKALPSTIQKKFDKQIRFLSENPKHPSLQMHKLNDEWEFYIDIHHRCFFMREKNRYLLLTVGTHKIVDRYRKRS